MDMSIVSGVEVHVTRGRDVGFEDAIEDLPKISGSLEPPVAMLGGRPVVEDAAYAVAVVGSNPIDLSVPLPPG